MPGKGNDEIFQLNYNEAVSMMNLKIIDNNHKILNSSLFLLEDSVLLCEVPETEIIRMRSDIFYVPPDYLVNPKDKALNELNDDILLYKKGYEDLCKIINENASRRSESIKNLIVPSKDLIKEIIKIIKDFELTIKNLCIPLISEKEGLDIDKNKLSLIQQNELIEDRKKIENEIKAFINESYNLNEKYSILFREIYKRIQAICDSIKEIPSTIEYLQSTVEDGMAKFEEILEELNEQENLDIFKNHFIKIKESYYLMQNIVKDVVKKIEEKEKLLNEKCESDKASFDTLKEERAKIIEQLRLKSNSIINNIKEIREKYKQKELQFPEIYISDLIIAQLSQSMEKSIKLINKENISVKEGVINLVIVAEEVISKKSLDLLFIMDTTGSMEQYVNLIKDKILNIIDEIKNNCLDVIINLGFIEYKDVFEIPNIKCNLDFTQDYDKIKEALKSIKVCGGDDTAEDVAWAFEQAKQAFIKKEKIPIIKEKKEEMPSNCRIAILITDAPCHGIKYHEANLMDNYPYGVIGREDIEELVDEMAKKKINLICIKIKEDTKKMFEMFEIIFKRNNCLFDVIPIKSPGKLVDHLAKKTSEIFKKNKL